MVDYSKIGHYCDFCKTFHSSSSCYHPGKLIIIDQAQKIAELELNAKKELEKFIEDIEFVISSRGYISLGEKKNLLSDLREYYPRKYEMITKNR